MIWLKRMSALCLLALVLGCGGVEETGPAEPTTNPPDPAEIQRMMEESMKKGGMEGKKGMPKKPEYKPAQ